MSRPLLSKYVPIQLSFIVIVCIVSNDCKGYGRSGRGLNQGNIPTFTLRDLLIYETSNQDKMQMSAQFHAKSALHLEKEPPVVIE
jgi:hypothetical protein